MAGTTYKWVSEQRLLYFTQKLKQHFPTASDFIDDTTAALNKMYSSSKVDSLLADKLDADDLTTIIDDTTTTADDKTWSAKKIFEIFNSITGIEFIKPEDGKLPATGKKGAIYLIPNGGVNPNIYDEYIWYNNDWEKIGTTEIDLSGYVQDTDMVEITTDEIDTIMTTVFGTTSGS